MSYFLLRIREGCREAEDFNEVCVTFLRFPAGRGDIVAKLLLPSPFIHTSTTVHTNNVISVASSPTSTLDRFSVFKNTT